MPQAPLPLQLALSASELDDWSCIVRGAVESGWLSSIASIAVQPSADTVIVSSTHGDELTRTYSRDEEWPLRCLFDVAHGYWRGSQNH